MDEPSAAPPEQDNAPIFLPENEVPSPPPMEEKKTRVDLTLWFILGGIVLVLLCCTLLWYLPVTELFPRAPGAPAPTLPPRTPLPTPNFPATHEAWAKPEKSPTLASAEEAKRAVESKSARYLAGPEPYIFKDIKPGDTYVYRIVSIDQPQPLIWQEKWCATTAEILDENFAHLEVEFFLNGAPVSSKFLSVYDDQPFEGIFCRDFAALVTDWPPGAHLLISTFTFLKPINNGWEPFPTGMLSFRYFVNVPP